MRCFVCGAEGARSAVLPEDNPREGDLWNLCTPCGDARGVDFDRVVGSPREGMGLQPQRAAHPFAAQPVHAIPTTPSERLALAMRYCSPDVARAALAACDREAGVPAELATGCPMCGLRHS